MKLIIVYTLRLNTKFDLSPPASSPVDPCDPLRGDASSPVSPYDPHHGDLRYRGPVGDLLVSPVLARSPPDLSQILFQRTQNLLREDIFFCIKVTSF